MKLTARGFNQALKFGAEIAIPLEVAKLDCGGVVKGSHGVVRAKNVVIASGARYRRPPISNLDMFEGTGVSYWASPGSETL